jgi:hypothetical protein
LPQIRLLVGINVDEIMEQYHQKGRLFLADAGRAMREFRDGLSTDIAAARYSPEVVFINHPTLAAEEEKFLLRAAQTAIKRATFARLQRDLNALEKAHKKTPLQASVLLDKTLEILGKYPLQESADARVEDARGGLSTAELAPAIILSESFAGH